MCTNITYVLTHMYSAEVSKSRGWKDEEGEGRRKGRGSEKLGRKENGGINENRKGMEEEGRRKKGEGG